MKSVMFISDLHLHPEDTVLMQRFVTWQQHALVSASAVYILGDFFHAWAGDDSIDSWSMHIATLLKAFHTHHIPVYWIAGNRDFLVGKRFAKLAHMTQLNDPSVIMLNGKRVLMTHGDQFCTKDRQHQWFRRCTRSRLFQYIFLAWPLQIRQAWVKRLRMRSQQRHLLPTQASAMPNAVMRVARRYAVDSVIHGHTHQPLLTVLFDQKGSVNYKVLSDWDESAHFLCYNDAKGYFFEVC